MAEYVYRVVDENGNAVEGGTFRNGRQHFYPKKSTAKGVSTSHKPKHYKVQRSEVVWEDCE